MGQTEYQSLESRIQANYADLPPAEKRLADLLLGFPGNIATYSASELADLAGTSKAAASRFFQRLGYKDFSEARRLVRGARTWGSPVYRSGAKTPEKKGSRIVSDHIEQETLNVSRALEALRPDIMRDIADSFVAARRVFVVGFRNSRFLAAYLQRQLTLTRDGVVLLPAAGQTLGEDLAELGPQDVVVVISLRRRIAMVEKIMAVAKKRNAKILLVSDTGTPSVQGQANWNLVCEVRSGSPFDSYTAAMSVLNLLVSVTYHSGLPVSSKRLEDIEALHDELDELEPYPWLAKMGNE